MDLIGQFSMLMSNAPGTELFHALPGYQSRKNKTLSLACRRVTFRRDPAEIQKFLSLKCNCPPRNAVMDMHHIGMMLLYFDDSPTPGEFMLHLCTSELRNVGKNLKNFHSMKLHNLSSRKIWPHSTGQLLPHGSEKTVLGLLDWIATGDAKASLNAVEALAALLHCAWSVVAPVMVKKRLVLDHFITSASRWRERLMMGMGSTNGAKYEEYATLVVDLLRLFLSVIRLICEEYSDPTAAAYFLRPRHEDVLVACDQILSATECTGFLVGTEDTQIIHNKIFESSIAVGRIIVNSFPECLPGVTRVMSNIKMKEIARSPESARAHLCKNLVNGLWFYHIRQQCASPGCLRTTEQRGRPSRYCTGCWWIPYCSK
jgi:hypothetical protein